MCDSQGSSFILEFYFILRKRPLDYLVMLFVGMGYEPDTSRCVWQILFFLNPVKITLAHMSLHSSITRTLILYQCTHSPNPETTCPHRLPPTAACTHTHTRLWLTPFKEHFRQNPEVLILNVAGKTHIFLSFVYISLCSFSEGRGYCSAKYRMHTKRRMQANVSVCFGCAL